MSDGDWYVLVEAMRDEDWVLVRTVHVEGDRAQALVRAAELTRTCGPSGSDRPGDDGSTYGRRVFRASETGWLVDLVRSRWSDVAKSVWTTSHVLRISVAELEYAQELVPVEPPPARKGVLRRARGR